MVATMIPRRPAQLFRSRWRALWWAMTVIVGALTTVGFGTSASKPGTTVAATDAPGQPVTDADLKALAEILNAT